MRKITVRDNPKAAGRKGRDKVAERIGEVQTAFPAVYLTALNRTFIRRKRQLPNASNVNTPPWALPLSDPRGKEFAEDYRALLQKLNEEAKEVGATRAWFETPEPGTELEGRRHYLIPIILGLGGLHACASVCITLPAVPNWDALEELHTLFAAALSHMAHSINASMMSHGNRAGTVTQNQDMFAHNCYGMLALFDGFVALDRPLLRSLRQCQNPRCLAPYFLRRCGPARPKYCSPACASLARTPQPKRPLPAQNRVRSCRS